MIDLNDIPVFQGHSCVILRHKTAAGCYQIEEMLGCQFLICVIEDKCVRERSGYPVWFNKGAGDKIIQ